MSQLAAPQMVINSQMLYTSWTPADPAAAAALLPDGVPMAGPVYMNQYVVKTDDQTSGFGAYSLTYLGLDIEGMMDPEGVLPGRYMLFYFNSNEVMREYTIREYDLPAEPGETALDIDEYSVAATTTVGGSDLIRTEAAIGSGIAMVARGQLTYVREKGGKFMAGNFPYIADMADGFEVRSVDFRDQSHPCWALRPAEPLQIETAVSFYSPDDSFVYPGGVEEVVF
ncbi:MAG: hypothetical protein ACR2N6_00340 [Miltoncostaeaceae bacterium]